MNETINLTSMNSIGGVAIGKNNKQVLIICGIILVVSAIVGMATYKWLRGTDK